MKRIRLDGTEMKVTRLCLGTWNMSGQEGWGPQEDEKSIELIRRVQDSGCNFFDTAHVYGGGHAEKVLGEALADGNRRERAIVSTKVMQGDPDGVEPQLDAALERMQTDYVDIYIVHWPRPSLSLPDFMSEMARMREEGKAAQIGVSNFNLEQMKVAAEYDIVSLQPPYNALWREIEGDVLPFCRENGIAVTPYSPLAQGLLTGRFSRGMEEKTGVRKNNVLFEEPVFSQARKAAAVVDQVADAHGWSSSQVALAWLLQTPGVTSPIVGISRWEHWEDNGGALEVELTDDEYEQISEAGMKVWEMLPENAAMWGWRPD